MTALTRIALIGFGEAGGILGADLAKQGCKVSAYDILIEQSTTRAALLAKAGAAHVTLCASLADALRDCELAISAVTASAAQDVARASGALLRTGQYFLDINSVSPDVKRADARLAEANGAHYVEAAVMAPVPPQRLQAPMLLGGAHAAALAERMRALGMNAKAVSDKVGVASAIKMCRSIMIKGLEALAVESMFAARRYGAEAAVLASLHATFPNMGWNEDLPDYLISRVAEHGRRRAAEMREVTVTVKDVGIDPVMAAAVARRHDALIDEMEAAGVRYDIDRKFSWRELADRLSGAASRG